MTDDNTPDPSRFLTPEAKQFASGVPTRGEVYGYFVQLTAVQSWMAEAIAQMLEGKNQQAISSMLKATQRLGTLQKSFEVIPGWRHDERS